MKYAPVLIATLNRHDHLRQCLDSLECCTEANMTTVYVALDYPPHEKYVDGWKKVDSYLHEKELQNRFGNLIVIRREHNYGLYGPNSNFRSLISQVTKEYDRYILTEDDNVFSPNFLEYINKGLEKYENDKSVLTISGYVQPYDFKIRNNTYYRHRTNQSAWGYGTWTKKMNDFENDALGDYFYRTFTLNNFLKVRKFGRTHLSHFFVYSLRQQNCDHRLTDQVMALYLIVHDMDTICPSVSKVRNIGWDELGNSFKGKAPTDVARANRYKTQTIDTNTTFEYIGDGYDYYDENNKVAASYQWSRWKCFRTCLRSIIGHFVRPIFYYIKNR